MHPDRPRDSAGVRIEPVEGAIVQEAFARYLEADGTLLGLAKHLPSSASSLRAGIGAGVRLPCTGSCRTRPTQRRSMLADTAQAGDLVENLA